jgi:hypothetical protein
MRCFFERSLAMNGRPHVWVCALVGIFVLAAALRAAADPLGYVLRIEGTWTAGGQNLGVGQSLAEGDIRRGLVGANPADRLTVVVAGKPHQCIGRCEPAALLALAGESRLRAAADAVLAPVMKIFKEKPDFPAIAVIRGSLNDGIATWHEGRLDVAGVLRECRVDRLHARFRRIEGEAPAERVIAFPCEEGRPASVSAKTFGPGLFEMALVERTADGYMPRGLPVWVLIVPRAQLAERTLEFDQARSLTESWGAEVEPETRSAVLRAYLSHLAQRK